MLAIELEDLEKQVQDVLANHTKMNETEFGMVDDMMKRLQACSASIKKELSRSDCTSENKNKRCLAALKELASETKRAGAVKKIKTSHRAIHNKMLSLGKMIDNGFDSETSWLNKVKIDDPSVLDKAVILHLAENGNFEAAESLIQESGSKMKLDDYIAVHSVLTALDEHDPEPVRLWIETPGRLKYCDRKAADRLTFALKRATFVSLVEKSNVMQAVDFARDHLVSYRDTHGSEILQLMGVLALEGDDQVLKETAAGQFTALKQAFLDCCKVVASTDKQSLLTVCLRAGELSLPRLSKYFRVVQQHNGLNGVNKSSEGLHEMEECPVEVDLEPDMRYHSIFTCPISREQTTTHNPPVLLKCGHVVAKTSMDKIVRSNGKLKCPTCPKMQTVNECKQLYF